MRELRGICLCQTSLCLVGLFGGFFYQTLQVFGEKKNEKRNDLELSKIALLTEISVLDTALPFICVENLDFFGVFSVCVPRVGFQSHLGSVFMHFFYSLFYSLHFGGAFSF